MRRLISMIVITMITLTARAAGEPADWYIYLYSESAGLNGDAGQFTTGDSDGEFILRGCEISASGINFCIHDSGWTSIFGWGEGGTISSTGTDYMLGEATSASGWMEIAEGTYDITWNAIARTIRLEASAETGTPADWYLYVYSEAFSLNGDLGQFKTTETEGVFVIDECNITEKGINFCIHDSSWSAVYGWSDNGGAVSSTGTDCELGVSTTASAWLDLAAGNYQVTWNSNDKTVRFDSPYTGMTIIDMNTSGNATAYDMMGRKVSATHKGLVIVGGKKYFNK